jgi:hypothetical protein
MKILRRSTAVGLGLLASVSLAEAQEAAGNPSLSKTWVFDVGAMFQSLDGNLSAVTSGGKGGSYDFSRLGLATYDTSLSASLRWRMSDRWRLEFAYDELDTRGGLANSSNLAFGRITIPAGYELDSSMKARTYFAFLGYSFAKEKDLELGGRLGLGVLDADASVGGHAFVGAMEVFAGPQDIGTTTLVPTVGLYATYALDDRLALEGAIDGIAGTVGAYSAHYLQLSGGVKYWLTDSLAVSGGYRFLDAKSEHDGNGLDTGIGVRSQGAYVKASAGF